MTSGAIEPEQLETWSRSRPGFLLVNRAIEPSPGLRDVPDELLARLDGERPDFLVTSREDLDRIGIVLSHDQMACFQRGEPIWMVVGRVEHREALKRGRRRKEELERQVQDALAMQTYVGIERLSAWLQARDGRRLAVTVPELRDRVLELLATDAWMDDPATGGLSENDERQAFFRTQYDAGGRLVSSWYRWAQRPDDLSRVARRIVAESAQAMSPPLIEEAIRREVNMIAATLRCLRKATAVVLTAHAMTAEIGRRERMTKGQQAVFSGAAGSDRLTFYEASRAALDGDFNPADLFGSLLSYHGALELARLLGRHGRGHDVRLEPEMVRELKRQFSIRAEFDATDFQPGEMPSDEQAAALVITQAGCELFSRERWLPLLDEAIVGGSALTLSR